MTSARWCATTPAYRRLQCANDHAHVHTSAATAEWWPAYSDMIPQRMLVSTHLSVSLPARQPAVKRCHAYAQIATGTVRPAGSGPTAFDLTNKCAAVPPAAGQESARKALGRGIFLRLNQSICRASHLLLEVLLLTAHAVLRSCLKKCKKYGRHGKDHGYGYGNDDDSAYKVRPSSADSLLLHVLHRHGHECRWTRVPAEARPSHVVDVHGPSLPLPQGHAKSFKKRHGKGGY